MSREHFQESQIEDRVTQLMEEGMSDEDAIQKAESEHDGRVNLVEDQALKINKRQVAFQKALRQGVYPSEIVLAMVVDHLQANYNSDSESKIIKEFCRELLTKINDDTLEVANAE
tara:strand:+ start:230 stop:574 length:345 start_codon:yes stop_codon:yes gene_type:complete